MGTFYAFYLRNISFTELAGELREFVKRNPPNLDEELTKGFIDFEEGSDYIAFKYYETYKRTYFDPARKVEMEEVLPRTVDIGVSREPFMLILRARFPRQRDRLLSLLPIPDGNRVGIEFSGDFIETLNKIGPEHMWYGKIMGEDMENIGRKGVDRDSSTHKIVEHYGGYDERDKSLEEKMVFRDYAILSVALRDITLNLKVYKDGKITVFKPQIPKAIDFATAIPYLSEAFNKIYQRFLVFRELSRGPGR